MNGTAFHPQNFQEWDLHGSSCFIVKFVIKHYYMCFNLKLWIVFDYLKTFWLFISKSTQLSAIHIASWNIPIVWSHGHNKWFNDCEFFIRKRFLGSLDSLLFAYSFPLLLWSYSILLFLVSLVKKITVKKPLKLFDDLEKDFRDQDKIWKFIKINRILLVYNFSENFLYYCLSYFDIYC